MFYILFPCFNFRTSNLDSLPLFLDLFLMYWESKSGWKIVLSDTLQHQYQVMVSFFLLLMDHQPVLKGQENYGNTEYFSRFYGAQNHLKLKSRMVRYLRSWCIKMIIVHFGSWLLQTNKLHLFSFHKIKEYVKRLGMLRYSAIYIRSTICIPIISTSMMPKTNLM